MTAPSDLETSEQNFNNNLEQVSAENSITPVADDLMAVNNLEGAGVSPENIAPVADDSLVASNLEGEEVNAENSISTIADDSAGVSN
ncbi:hypothetical protein QT981_18805, partial [Microcoleus sp. herbarium13]